MLQNAYFVAKIGADTAENEQHFVEICQKLATTLRVRRADDGPVGSCRGPGAGRLRGCGTGRDGLGASPWRPPKKYAQEFEPLSNMPTSTS